MPHCDSNRKSDVLQTFFEDLSHDLSRATGFVQRTSKMTGERFAETVILGWVANPDAPLNDLVQRSAQLGVQISEAGLQQRINARAVAFLQALFAASIARFRERVRLPAHMLSQFSQINVVDSSLVRLPDELQTAFKGFNTPGSAAAAKLQLRFDYLTGDFNALQVQDGREPDQNCPFPVQYAVPQSLALFDLGYAKFDQLQTLTNRQAYFITRLATRIVVYQHVDDDAPLDLVQFLARQGDHGEVDVSIGLKKQVRVRLIFQKLPPAVVAERRRKVKRTAQKKQHGITAKHLALQAWNLFITNLPIDRASSQQVLQLYRVRWQAELLFKLWKSQAKLSQVGTYRPARVVCQLYARLLGVVLFNWLAAPLRLTAHGELSLPKAWRVFQQDAWRLLDAIADDWQAVPRLLDQLRADFLRFGLKNLRRKSPSTLQRLIQSGLA